MHEFVKYLFLNKYCRELYPETRSSLYAIESLYFFVPSGRGCPAHPRCHGSQQAIDVRHHKLLAPITGSLQVPPHVGSVVFFLLFFFRCRPLWFLEFSAKAFFLSKRMAALGQEAIF